MADEPIRCEDCRRPIRTPESQARRMGPDCWRKRHPPVRRRTVVRVPARSVVEQMELWEEEQC